MPLIDIEQYVIDFLILESNDPRTLILLDRSRYLSNPDKPRLDITLPGFTGSIEIPYNINGITVIDSDTLKLTTSADYNNLIELPDGVYHIRQKVCPYDQLFATKCYLKTQRLQASYEDVLLNMDNTCDCFDVNKLTQELVAIDMLIRSARAEIASCNVYKATEKYNIAARKIAKAKTILNCCK